VLLNLNNKAKKSYYIVRNVDEFVEFKYKYFKRRNKFQSS